MLGEFSHSRGELHRLAEEEFLPQLAVMMIASPSPISTSLKTEGLPSCDSGGEGCTPWGTRGGAAAHFDRAPAAGDQRCVQRATSPLR